MPSKTRVIGLGHLSRVGKDSAATYLQHYLQARGKSVKCVSFAWKLKEITFDLFEYLGVKRPVYYENHPEARQKPLANGKTVVELWVAVGNLLRQVDDQVWIVNAISDPDVDFIIVRDVRYQNEIDSIREFGGTVYRVDRPGHFGLDTVADNQLRSYDKWDGYIMNDGDLKRLSETCRDVVDGWLRG